MLEPSTVKLTLDVSAIAVMLRWVRTSGMSYPLPNTFCQHFYRRCPLTGRRPSHPFNILTLSRVRNPQSDRKIRKGLLSCRQLPDSELWLSRTLHFVSLASHVHTTCPHAIIGKTTWPTHLKLSKSFSSAPCIFMNSTIRTKHGLSYTVMLI